MISHHLTEAIVKSNLTSLLLKFHLLLILIWQKTYLVYFSNSVLILASAFTMSSVEEPLGLDKLPSMSTIDRIQRFSSGACRPIGDDIGMGICWIEGGRSSLSNSCR